MKPKKVPIIAPERLRKTRSKLAAKEATVRVLHLGDSHVASDYITGMARHGLQKAYGSGGAGFSHIDQAWGYGGRRLQRSDAHWLRDRIVDKGRAGLPFGFSGVSIDAKKKNARAIYRVEPSDTRVRIFYQQKPKGAPVEVRLGKKSLGTFTTDGPKESKVFEATFEPGKKPRKLTLIAKGKGARLYGISFESQTPGLVYTAIGPVGADAKVYRQLDPQSFSEHLVAYRPDLVVLMVGGNDALKIRKGWTTMEAVTEDHDAVLTFLKEKLPEAECMLWTPMDAGKKKGKKVVSKDLLPEIRALHLKMADKHGCAVWDLYETMGGEGSITRWVGAKVMNKDLIHPKKRAADLLGSLFVEAWLSLP